MAHEMIGKKFNYLTVVEGPLEKPKNQIVTSNDPWWLCACKCGNNKLVIERSLLNGLTKSCGCLRKNNIIARNKKSKENSKIKRMSAR